LQQALTFNIALYQWLNSIVSLLQFGLCIFVKSQSNINLSIYIFLFYLQILNNY